MPGTVQEDDETGRAKDKEIKHPVSSELKCFVGGRTFHHQSRTVRPTVSFLLVTKPEFTVDPAGFEPTTAWL